MGSDLFFIVSFERDRLEFFHPLSAPRRGEVGTTRNRGEGVSPQRNKGVGLPGGGDIKGRPIFETENKNG
jgi:hypothetical protein